MKKKNDGGSAFPLPMTMDQGGNFHHSGEHPDRIGGMTLLDWFAGKALAGWVSTLGDVVDDYDGEPEAFYQHTEAVAQLCYDYGVAMIAEKQKREGE